MEDVYKKLAQHLDNTPSGFPATESGVELRILKQLFTPEQARIAQSLVMMLEPAEVIAQRAGMPVEEIEPILIEMGKKGLIIHVSKNGHNTFMQLHFVVGIWEYQVNNLTKQLIEDFNEYVPHLIKNQTKVKTQQFRVVPVNKAVNTSLDIMDYERVEQIINAQSRILVAPCICRREHSIMEKGCGRPEETCLVFGSGAYIYESRGIGRVISKEEALDIVKQGVKQGLVPQPSNSKKPTNICLCCNCCCQILKNIKEFEAPAKIVNSNFQARVDEQECTGCQACEEICPMDAIAVDAEKIIARVDYDRCIGCGLCVGACAFDAMTLADKQQDEKIEPPANIIETYMNIAKEKGLF